jgi:hypothetical protein
MEEMNTIKDDLQFILDNNKNSKSFMKIKERDRDIDRDKEKDRERLDTSIFNSENLNSSYVHSTSKLNNSYVKNNEYNYLNNNVNNTCYNLNEKMEEKQLTKFQEFLTGFNSNKNILLLIDGKGLIWELIKRKDLDISRLSNDEYVTSCCSIFDKDNYKEKNKIYGNEVLNDKLLNIEIKEDEDKSYINSELDISKVSDMNISQLIKDTNNNSNENENDININCNN